VAEADDNAPERESREQRKERRRQERAARMRPSKSQAGQESQRTGFGQFIRECWAELKRVQWPTRPVLVQATAVVIITCFIVGVYLYALDSVFSRLAGWLITQQAG
jgi:preprotein translocase subunit SecE